MVEKFVGMFGGGGGVNPTLFLFLVINMGASCGASLMTGCSMDGDFTG